MALAREPDLVPVDNFDETAKNEVPQYFTVNSGRRFYSPELGRWLNRDPIGEVGGANLCEMCSNDVIGMYDYLGNVTVKKVVERTNEPIIKSGTAVWGWASDAEPDGEKPAKLIYKKNECICRVVRKPELRFLIKIVVVKSGRQTWSEDAQMEGARYPERSVYVSDELAAAAIDHETRRFKAWEGALKSYYSREYENLVLNLTAPTCRQLETEIAFLYQAASRGWETSTEGRELVAELLAIGVGRPKTQRWVRSSIWRGVYVEYDVATQNE